MVTKTQLLNHVEKLFEVKQFWTTDELYLEVKAKYARHPSKVALGGLLSRKYFNLNKGTDKGAIWKVK